MDNHFRVAIFGSARIKKDDWEYKIIYQLGKMLAQESISLVTGGGPGLMDAASRGHHAGKGNNNVHSVGLTIILPHETKEQRAFHLDIQQDFERFSSRLDSFMEYSHAVIVAPGGVGTLLELFYTWQLVQVKHICDMPIILMGPMWKGLVDWIRTHPMRKNLLSESDVDRLFVAQGVKETIDLIKKAKMAYEEGKHVCHSLAGYR
ncbi:MAG TPA: LOG family protein [Candidatus Nanoarchaeia archaeon]|nr:LOG family protein [Candidatus Nanoarchaeia archaeon]